jgi:hypothetical protein
VQLETNEYISAEQGVRVDNNRTSLSLTACNQLPCIFYGNLFSAIIEWRVRCGWSLKERFILFAAEVIGRSALKRLPAWVRKEGFWRTGGFDALRNAA